MNDLFYRRFIQPRSALPALQHREYILNVLLASLTLLSSVSLAVVLVENPYSESMALIGPLVEAVCFWLAMILLWLLSRLRKPGLAAIGLVAVVAFFSIRTMLMTSFMATGSELALALTIVTAGAVLSSAGSIITTTCLCASGLAIGYTQSHQHLNPTVGWLNQPLIFADDVLYTAVLFMIGLIVWMASRSISRLFAQARQSEADLEVQVRERTHRLERLQLKRVEQAQRFVQFGRQTAGVIHDVSNALAVLGMDLERLETTADQQVIGQMRRSARQLERYFAAARKQIIGESEAMTFSVVGEIRQAVEILRYPARGRRIVISVTGSRNVDIYGDPVKFNQAIANLILNSIDAFPAGIDDKKSRRIRIEIKPVGRKAVITVTDNGIGIPPKHLERIFEPLFTTKSASKRGMGLGLTMVKSFIEADFNGSIAVTSKVGAGTKCTLKVPISG